jgi:thiol-disulfide isomerase/thioredoxin
MRSFGLVCAFSLLAITSLKAQAPSPSADDILKEAFGQAAKENKNVFIIFHASWCGWCRKMDTSMNDKAVKKYFDDNYVIRHLVVYESKGKEKLENPGATDLLIKYKGNDQGIPYWLIFDRDGKLLADSKMRPEDAGLEQGDNSGCPASEPEVQHFIDVLKKTSALNDEQLKIIYGRFRKNDVN